MTITDDPKWRAAAVRARCNNACTWPECEKIALHDAVRCSFEEDIRRILTALTPLIDAAIAEAVEREREAARDDLNTEDAILERLFDFHHMQAALADGMDMLGSVNWHEQRRKKIEAFFVALNAENVAIRARGEPAPDGREQKGGARLVPKPMPVLESGLDGLWRYKGSAGGGGRAP